MDSSDFEGTITLLSFGATRSPASVQQIADLSALQSQYNPEDVTVVGVLVDSAGRRSIGLVRSFLHTQKPNYPMLVGDAVIYGAYGIQALPVTFIIDGNGMVRRVHRGHQTQHLLQQDVELMRAGKPLPPASPMPVRPGPDMPGESMVLGEVTVSPNRLGSSGGVVTVTVKSNGTAKTRDVEKGVTVEAVIAIPGGALDSVDLHPDDSHPETYTGAYAVPGNPTSQSQVYWVGLRIAAGRYRLQARRRAFFEVAAP